MIYRYVKKQKNAKREVNILDMTLNFAHRMVMPAPLEQELVNYVQTRAQMLSGITVLQLQKIAYMLAERNNSTMPESWKQDKLASALSNYASNRSFS